MVEVTHMFLQCSFCMATIHMHVAVCTSRSTLKCAFSLKYPSQSPSFIASFLGSHTPSFYHLLSENGSVKSGGGVRAWERGQYMYHETVRSHVSLIQILGSAIIEGSHSCFQLCSYYSRKWQLMKDDIPDCGIQCMYSHFIGLTLGFPSTMSHIASVSSSSSQLWVYLMFLGMAQLRTCRASAQWGVLRQSSGATRDTFQLRG